MSDTDELRTAIEEIWEYGTSSATGLDPFPIHFEIVPAKVMYEVGAYGVPGRFSHWTHGKAFHQMKTMYDYGLSKIYELIINTDPAQAYLMEANSLVQNKLVIAHVIGHSDFFKNNVYFAHTDRQMAETAGVTAERIRAYEYEHGEKAVEEFLDACLALQEHIDPNLRVTRGKPGDPERDPNRRRVTEYDDLWQLVEKDEEVAAPARRRIPAEPEKDLLLFLLQYAPDLEPWQRDILQIVRNEMLYFLPQMQTKVMNEGWASYWHSRILREMDFSGEEHVEFTRLHSGVLSPSPRGTSINPYYVGFKIFEDIERRWNGDLSADERKEYAEANQGREWPYKDQGRHKMFEVRELENDVSFLRNYLTKRLVDELDMYIYRREDDEWVVVEKDWRKIRDSIVESMTNFGYPYLVIEDGDYNRARELYIKHCFDGREMDQHYAFRTMRYLYQLWGRPVHLETIVDDEKVVWTWDGENEIVEQDDAESAVDPV
jgi:stage V sporulation protein R